MKNRAMPTFCLTFPRWEGVGYENLAFQKRLLYYCDHMRLFVRYLLWLLIAVLPLQGSVAAVMACSVVQKRPGPSVHHVADPAPSQAVAQGHCGTAKQEHAAGSHGKCSQCASCCVGVAAPPVMRTEVVPVNFSISIVAAPEPAMTLQFPSTLERPPRRFL